MSLMALLANAMIIVLILLVLMVLQPIAALFAALIVGSIYAIVFRVIRSQLIGLGEKRLAADRLRFQVMHEALAGIKEVKAFSLESAYLRRFRDPAKRLVAYQSRMALISEMPRNLLEGLLLGGMLIFVMSLLITGTGDVIAAIPVLGTYAFAGIRLFPTVQRIYGNYTTMRFAQPALNSLHADMSRQWLGKLEIGPMPEPLTLGTSVELRDVTFSYVNSIKPALEKVSLKIEVNSTVGFVGSTGAGKSTAVDILLGLLQPDKGSLRVDGIPITTANVRSWQRAIGYVPQNIFLCDDTLAANIAFGEDTGAVDMDRVQEVSAIAQLDAVVRDLPRGFDTRLGEQGIRLSGGQRQRVGIARALYRRPHILIFDEATSALDNLTERAVMDAVEQLSHRTTIIQIAHRLTTVKKCDQIFMLEYGHLVAAGTYDELLANSDAFRALEGAAA